MDSQGFIPEHTMLVDVEKQKQLLLQRVLLKQDISITEASQLFAAGGLPVSMVTIVTIVALFIA